MKLSRTVTYAVRAALQLARSNSSLPVPCSRLAAEGAMPERFLLQILRVLVTHGILKSTRGVDGGYSLTRPAEQVTLLEIVEAVDGPLDGPTDAGDAAEQHAFDDRLRAAMQTVRAGLRRELAAITLAHLAVPVAPSPAALPPVTPAPPALEPVAP